MEANRQFFNFLVVAGLLLTTLVAYRFSETVLRKTGVAAVSVDSSAAQEGNSPKMRSGTRLIHQNHTKDVSYVVKRPIREERSCAITYTHMDVVWEQVTKIDPATGKEITYTVTRNVPEQREKIVNYDVTTLMPVQMQKSIGYQTFRFETIEQPTVADIIEDVAEQIRDWIWRCCSRDDGGVQVQQISSSP